jgi:hypothetical protein
MSYRNHKPAANERWRHAESLVAKVFRDAGWDVQHKQSLCDMLVRRADAVYAVEVKAGVEGRADRLVPLFAQAVLEAARAAGNDAKALAVVAAPKINKRVADQILEFASEYAPEVAAGVIDFEGFRVFRDPQLEGLNAQAKQLPHASKSPRFAGHLFSDLNQWMLKVLLAPEIPEHLLAAPRGSYENASRLAEAAGVSMMSAFRFVQLLREEGYLSHSEPRLSLVRREDLFSRWQASALRAVKEVPMRFLIKGDGRLQLRGMLKRGRACLGLFAAAQELKLGFVEGVQPYIYVERIQPSQLSTWKNLRPCEAGETPDLILRQAPFPQSIFRGMVWPDGIAASDILQVWLDVSAHPSRGREQADLIRRRVLGKVIENRN